MKKKLVILSGFLGSGKTSFLSLLLERYKHLKLAVLLNDFGEAPVDSTLLDLSDLENCEAKDRMVELGGGSVFCACLKESFVKALMAMADTDAEMLIIEASGMSDPAGMSTLLRLAKLDHAYETPSVLCLFDPVKSLKLSNVLEVIPRQLKAASAVVLTKADITSEDERSAALEYIRTITANAPVYEHGFGKETALGCLNDSGELVADATGTADPMGSMLGFNTNENRPDSFIIRTAPSGIDALVAALSSMKDVLRVKGYLPEGDSYKYLSDTGKGYQITESNEAPVPLTVICMQGTGATIQNNLSEQNLMG